MSAVVPDAIRKTLGAVVRERRRELGLSQEELAELVGDGITQSQVSELERDITQLPRRARLELIADALRLPLGELLARSGWTEADRYFAEADGARPGGLREVAPVYDELRSELISVIDRLTEPQRRSLLSFGKHLQSEGTGKRKRVPKRAMRNTA